MPHVDLDDLEAWLIDAGYGSKIDERGPRLLSVGDLRIDLTGATPKVGITERGEMMGAETFSSVDDACQAFADRLGHTSSHLATFTDRAAADAAGAALSDAGITSFRNDIASFNGPGDARYRIFVPGPSLRSAQAIVRDHESRD